jgi:glycosyltransferase involved in cell wall biosynthesis
MSVTQDMRVGVVIPSYNEGNDLIETLRSVLNQSCPFIEVIVVDDSSDGTDQLVTETFGERVRLIHRDSPQGRCSARNMGVRLSTAEIVIILNADVCLPFNFCERIQAKYREENCDALGVETIITNVDHPYPRYLQALHSGYPKEKLGWTEGFSVRRSAFLKTKGFPDGFPVPILAGEDGEFVFDLLRTGAKLAFDFIYEQPLWKLLLRSIAKQILRVLTLITVLPFIWRVVRRWSYFNHGWGDLLQYARYELYIEWLKTDQEWSDLVSLSKLHRQNHWTLSDIFLKPPSQLTTARSQSC